MNYTGIYSQINGFSYRKKYETLSIYGNVPMYLLALHVDGPRFTPPPKKKMMPTEPSWSNGRPAPSGSGDPSFK